MSKKGIEAKILKMLEGAGLQGITVQELLFIFKWTERFTATPILERMIREGILRVQNVGTKRETEGAEELLQRRLFLPHFLSERIAASSAAA